MISKSQHHNRNSLEAGSICTSACMFTSHRCYYSTSIWRELTWQTLSFSNTPLPFSAESLLSADSFFASPPSVGSNIWITNKHVVQSSSVKWAHCNVTLGYPNIRISVNQNWNVISSKAFSHTRTWTDLRFQSVFAVLGRLIVKCVRVRGRGAIHLPLGTRRNCEVFFSSDYSRLLALTFWLTNSYIWDRKIKNN